MKLSHAVSLAVFLILLTALTLAPTVAQDVTPLPPADIGDVTGLEQSLTSQGYPQIGSSDAPIQIIVFCAYDALACGEFYESAFFPLLERVEAGDAQIVYLPLYGANELENGRAAASAAICAAQQGAFWSVSELFYQWQTEIGGNAFESSRIRSAVESLGLNQTAWNDCMLSDHPTTVLEKARLDADLQEGFTDARRPYVLVNGVPTLPDADSVAASVDLVLNEAEATPDPASTAEVTEPPQVVTLEPLLGESLEPPLTLSLPAGWRYGYDALVMNDVDVAMRTIPVAVYTGPVTGGTGTIVLLWGFPNLVALSPLQTQTLEPDLWSDGLRLLRLTVIEQGCNIGTDLRTEYTIGGRAATGTQFSAVDCPDLPDTRGWFAGLQENGINFIFYVFTDPIDAMNTAEPELQAILDTVEFRVPLAVTATPAP